MRALCPRGTALLAAAARRPHDSMLCCRRSRSQSVAARWSAAEAPSISASNTNNNNDDHRHGLHRQSRTVRYTEPADATITVKEDMVRVAAPQEVSPSSSSPSPSKVEPATPVVNSSKATQSFYRRPLPAAHCVAFSSPEGRRLFQEALAQGGMESYFPLSEQFKTQDDPAFCGLGALTMVLNALAIDPGRTWKGPWRWFDESMLECCEPLDVVRAKGICISKLNCLAQCNGATTRLKYGDVTSLKEFRQDIMRTTHQVSTSTHGELLIVGYNRKVLGQTGTGHFSPVGGYHRGNDVALIMDVARFKYPPHWVPVPVLYEAMQTPDPETGRSRGYMLVTKGMVSESLLFTIDKTRYLEWEALGRWLRSAAGEMKRLLNSSQSGLPSSSSTGILVDHDSILPHFLTSLPPSVASLVTTYHEALCLNYSVMHQSSINTLIAAIEDHPIYELLGRHEDLLCQFREGWRGCCARKVLNERHLLTMMYVSVVEWVSGNGGGRRVLFDSTATIDTAHPLLQLEVAQLKRKFDAMAVVQPPSSPTRREKKGEKEKQQQDDQ